MSAKRKEPVAPLFDEIVFAPDRESIPGARPVVSFDEDDDSEYLASIEAVACARAQLVRRGRDHGAWAELDLSASGLTARHRALDPEPARERWQAARPLLLPSLISEIPAQEVEAGLQLGARLAEPAGLEQWVREGAQRLPANWKAVSRDEKFDDERTLAKLYFEGHGEGHGERHGERHGESDGEGTGGPDLWLKSGRLSTFEGDASVRLRASFGLEVHDDVSRDETAHRAVTSLAEAVLPAALRIDFSATLQSALKALTGVETYFTQHIAYWNAQNGGALMHHDAFGEEDNGGQLGVAYTQIAGTTAWLALSIEDLAARLDDYAEFLDEGGAEWLLKELWPDRHDFDRVRARMNDRPAFLAELATPGCGRFGALINRGPEFTSFLADAGHAVFLRPGDVLLMPSHGLDRCVMHSVFAPDDSPTYAISAALRSDVGAS